MEEFAFSDGFAEDIILAARQDAKRGEKLIDALKRRSGLQGRSFLSKLAATARLQAFHLFDLDQLTPDFERLDYAEALQRECAPLRDEKGRLLLAISDPFDSNLRDWAELRFAGQFRACLALAEDISAILARHEVNRPVTEHAETNDSATQASAIEDISLKRINEDSSPNVRLVNSTLYDALRLGASDIHMESTAGAMVIKYRIDGVLNNVALIKGSHRAEQAISRIKVMAELDIAEHRIPQDGRFKVAHKGRDIDFRVSIMPSIHGEDAVLRILDKQSLADAVAGLSFDSLGFDASIKQQLRRMCNEPYGMLLVTGPTGSGKTTTLYAALGEINNGRDKIITIEDPVEYELPGVLQIPVNEKKGLTFARGLRSILRHDPDRIMVGEIRDSETAQIAIQAALTGHLVFTTVHANNAFDVIGRFMHLDVDPYNLVSALNAVVAQRLVRINCQHCTEPITPDPSALIYSAIPDIGDTPPSFRAGKGCAKCNGTGFHGRRAIAELLVLTDELREMILDRQPLRKIKEAARHSGMRNLREAGIELVLRGDSTFEEINRVTFVE